MSNRSVLRGRVGRAKAGTCLMLVLLAPAIAGANTDAETACHNAANTGAINACLDKVYTDLDRQVNAAYKGGIKRIEASGLQPNLAKDWRRAYLEAQRKWLAFRDADCGAPVSYEWSGGSGTGAMQLGCKIARTRERLDTLKRRYGRED